MEEITANIWNNAGKVSCAVPTNIWKESGQMLLTSGGEEEHVCTSAHDLMGMRRSLFWH